MKKNKPLLLVIAFCMLSLLGFGREAISLSTGQPIAVSKLSPVVRDVSVSDDGNTIDITYQFSDIGRDKGSLPNTQIWFLEGFDQTVTVGLPSLPISNDILHIPQGMIANVAVIDSTYIDIPSSICPAMALQSENAIGTTDVTPISSYVGFFPKSTVWIDRTASYRGENLLYIGISPVQYDMENNIARIKSSITYRVTFSPKTVAARAATGDTIAPAHIISRNDNLIGNIALNASTTQRKARAVATAGTEPLLILTHPTHAEAVRHFVHWKRVLGFDVTVLSKSNWTPQTIKDEIQNQKSTHPELKYILILGSHKQIPAEYISDTGNYTDFYYSLSPTNTAKYPIPDYALGRLPAQTADQSMTMVKKIIDYERIPPTDASFYNNALNCAGFECEKNYNHDPYEGLALSTENLRFVKRSEEVRDYMLSFGYNVNRAYFKILTNYKPVCYNPNFCTEKNLKMPDEILYSNYSWNSSTDDVVDAINKGCFMTLLSYHGQINGIEYEPNRIKEEWFGNNAINHLSNQKSLPIVFSINCHTGSFQYDNAFLPNLLSYENGGAVAAFGFTNSSYTRYNDCLLAGMIDAIWPEPGFRIKPTRTTGEQIPANPSFRLGDILIQGKAVMNSFKIKTDKQVNDTAVSSLEMLHCLGDPTMEIRTLKPTYLGSDVRVSRLGNDILVLVDKPSRVTFFNEVTGEVVSEETTGTGFSCDNPDNITVCVSRSNTIPYIEYTKVSPYIQNTFITGDFSIKADKVYMGSEVIYDKNKGGVHVHNDASISIETKEIIFAPGVEIPADATLEITITE